MSYIDGFVIAVPTTNKQKFIEHANNSDTIFNGEHHRRQEEVTGPP